MLIVVGNEEGKDLSAEGGLLERTRQVISMMTQVAISRRVQRSARRYEGDKRLLRIGVITQGHGVGLSP